MRGLVATVVLFVALSATAREERAGENRPESRLLMRLLDKVERLQGELQEVRGRSDRQERELRALRRKMRELEGRSAAAATPATGAEAAPAAPIMRPPATAAEAAPAAATEAAPAAATDAAPTAAAADTAPAAAADTAPAAAADATEAAPIVQSPPAAAADTAPTAAAETAPATAAETAPATAADTAPAATADTAPAAQPPSAEREAPDDDVQTATEPANETPQRVQAPSSGDGEAPDGAAQAARADGARAPQPHEQRLGFLPKDAATPNERDERRAYQQATRALDDNDYALLRQDLDVFLRSWPRGRYAANAKFWIGEAWYAERRLDEAEHYYKRVIEENADHQKSEDAHLKLAYIHIDREQWDAAAAVLQNLADAATQERIRALAQKKLGQVKQRER